MVQLSSPALDRVFGALTDPTRRALLARLAEGGDLTVSDLARPLPMSLPAVMKHLDVLEAAGLLARQKSGRSVTCRLVAQPLEDATAWLQRYARFWDQSLDRLAAALDGAP